MTLGILVTVAVSLTAILGVVIVWALLARGRGVREDHVHRAEVAGVLSSLSQELQALRHEAKAEAAAARTSVAETQAQHMGALQRQSADVLGLVQQQVNDLRRQMDERMQGLTGTVGQQLEGSAKVIRDVQAQLGALGETARHIQGLGRDIAELQNILRAPKLRGNLGEMLLEELLRQILPASHFQMQYRLREGDGTGYVTVDAVIQLGERLVPVDSKFPLETFTRLSEGGGDDERKKLRRAFIDVVKKHIDVVAQKYIRPDLGTYEFALMYMPAENVYYEAAVGQGDEPDVLAYAASQRVIPVSPNTMYAYLMTVAYGLRGLQIEKQAEVLRGQLVGFQRKFGRFYDTFDKVGNSLGLARKHFDDAHKKAQRLGDELGTMTGMMDSLEAPAAKVKAVAANNPELPFLRQVGR